MSSKILSPLMAKRPTSAILTASVLTLLFVFIVVNFPTPGNGLGGKVGGRSKVKDVKTNKEVQELGRYSVDEYNRVQRGQRSNGDDRDLKFSEVVSAETQVVSGIKYYLKVAAFDTPSGVPKTFDAVVVVKPWVHSKELLNFAPSPATK